MTLKRKFLTLGALALVIGTVPFAYAQFNDPGQRGPQPGGQPGMGMRGGGGGGGSIAVSGNAVYVLLGGRVMKLNANTLEVEKEVRLPVPGPREGGERAPRPRPMGSIE